MHQQELGNPYFMHTLCWSLTSRRVTDNLGCDPILRLLMLYNLAFLGPVILVMVAAWCGTTSFALANWSRRNVIWGKILLGVFFLTLAVLILSV